MLVMTAKRGASFRNDRSLSSASATRYLPRPSRALLPNALTRPPMTAVGSRPAASSIKRDHRSRRRLAVSAGDGDSFAQLHQLGQHLGPGNHRDAARARGGHFGIGRPHGGRIDDTLGVADVRASWPLAMRAPSLSSRSVMSLRCMSDPVTSYPRFTRSSAMPLMPIPPMPTK